MKIFHLNCGTMAPYGLPSADDTGGFFRRGYGVTHCLLADTGDGLVLVDTGWGQRDYADPSPIVHRFMNLVGCPRDVSETAIRQVESLGYRAEDVRHIVLTHLHMDHAGGLPDFPKAQVHVYADELEACLRPRMFVQHPAYRPEHRSHHPRWQPHSLGGDQWFGIDCTPPVKVGEAEIVMVPFTGHTRGHCGVALRDGSRWLLHCGDAYGYFRQVGLEQPYRHPCGRLIETLVRVGFKMPRRHWHTIRELVRAHGEEVQVFCAHDGQEFEMAGAEM